MNHVYSFPRHIYLFFFFANANATWIVAWTRLSVYCPSFADYENFSPKEKKEIPKGKDQKSESKGEYIYFAFELL
jgi:hypothetical protein